MSHSQTWKLSTAHFGASERTEKWNETLQRIHLPPATASSTVDAEVISATTARGLEFSRIKASPQIWSGKLPAQPYSLWIALLRADSFLLQSEGHPIAANSGDILFGASGTDASLSIDSDFEMLYIKVPTNLLHHRLLNPSLLGIGFLSRDRAANRVFADFLASVCLNLDDASEQSMYPIEVAITEFLVSCLAPHTMIEAFGNNSKLALYRRVCSLIEDQIKDPDLSLGTIAAQENISRRYIQKLFEMVGTNFSQFVRERRLDHCRNDLLSSEYRHLSISDICYRWGFNDAAHFSRSFHRQYGQSPRAFRQSHQLAA